MEMYDNYNQFHDWIVEEDTMYREILSDDDKELYEEINDENATTGLLESQLMNIHLYIDYFENESENCLHRHPYYRRSTCSKGGYVNECKWNTCPLAEGKDWNNG
jgi:hypothetical protein